MENQALLHPDNAETQNQEVNSGVSLEPQNITSQEPSTPVEETEPQSTVATVEELQSVEETEPQATVDTVEEPQSVEETEPQSMVATVEEPQSVEEMMSELDQQQSVQEHESVDTVENPAEAISAPEETIEQVEAEYADLDLQQCVEEMERLVEEPNFNLIKQRVGVLRVKVNDFLKERKRAAKAAYDTAMTAYNAAMAQNPEALLEEPDAPSNEPDEIEVRFNKALQTYKDSKAKFLDALEAQRQKNLETKIAIIEELKKLLETESNLKVLNDKFKELQEQWREVGPVPQSESTNLWQNYHFQVEKFYDIVRLNREARELDYKKNLERKLELCEKAESLLLEDSINQSFRELQTLHEQWKEIGPVPEDKKEEVWERFKVASDQINQRRKEHYDKIFAEAQNNYNAKVVLCEQAEELTAKPDMSVKEYNEVSEKLADLLSMWKTLGQAPAKLNDEIWARFKGTLDRFFTQKKAYFQTIKDVQMQNYNQKLDLAIQAEAIADRTDWKQATADILKLQEEWKKIGTTSRKYSDQVWKRFRAACDKFFEAKANYFSNVQGVEAENLQKKEELIQKILTHEFGDDRQANMDVLKAYQNEWISIGFVPKKDKDRIYNAYRAALDKRFAELKISNDDMRHIRYQNRINDILNNPNANQLIDKEKRFLMNKISQLKEDIALWENNLGFFANSKNAEIITADFRKKIESAKNQVKDLEYKVRMMNSPKASEEVGTPTEQTMDEPLQPNS